MQIEAGPTGLYYGTSPELPGSLIMGETQAQVVERLEIAQKCFRERTDLWQAFKHQEEIVPGHMLQRHSPTNSLILLAKPEALQTNDRRREFFDRFRLVILLLNPPAGSA